MPPSASRTKRGVPCSLSPGLGIVPSGVIYPDVVPIIGNGCVIDPKVLLEEMGRALVPGPFVPTVVLVGRPILAAGSEEQKQQFLPGIASGDLIARANSGTLRNEEYSNTTFSISNLGMFDVDSFMAIISPPHAAILAVGAVKEQPVVRSGQLAVARVMKATLSVDHRVADGAQAAQFIGEIKRVLESPVTLLV